MGDVQDDLATTLELPPTARAVSRARSSYNRLQYEVRHPENHKQLVRFLCVGASGYLVNLATFAICIHLLKVSDAASLVIAFLVGCSNNFVWNRHWTFDAREEHPFRQGLRFFAVSTLVFFFATGIYDVLTHDVGIQQKVLSDGIAWMIATPLSFVFQKLWSFRA
jgi:putative flippase GtrA